MPNSSSKFVNSSHLNSSVSSQSPSSISSSHHVALSHLNSSISSQSTSSPSPSRFEFPPSPQQPRPSLQQHPDSPFTPVFGSVPLSSPPSPRPSPWPPPLEGDVSSPPSDVQAGVSANVRYINSNFGCKYYASCAVNGKVVTFMIDTGADCSCFPPDLIDGAPVEKIDEPFRIFGFHAASEPHIVDEIVPLELSFDPGKIQAKFMVCETAENIPIIGADLLRSNVGISLDTSCDLLTVGNDVIHVKPSVRTSKKEYFRRKRIGTDEYRRQNACLNGRERWMRVSQRVALPPHSMTYVECEIDGARMPEGVFSMMSLYDDNGSNDIIAASLTFSKPERAYIIPVENRSSKKVVL